MKIACPHCTQRIDLDESWLGKLLDCPNCQGIIDVPRQATYEAMDTHAKNAANLASLTQNLRRVRIAATAVLILVPI